MTYRDATTPATKDFIKLITTTILATLLQHNLHLTPLRAMLGQPLDKGLITVTRSTTITSATCHTTTQQFPQSTLAIFRLWIWLETWQFPGNGVGDERTTTTRAPTTNNYLARSQRLLLRSQIPCQHHNQRPSRGDRRWTTTTLLLRS